MFHCLILNVHSQKVFKIPSGSNSEIVLFQQYSDSAFYFPKVDKLIDSLKITKGPLAVFNNIFITDSSNTSADTMDTFQNLALTKKGLKNLQSGIFKKMEEQSFLNSRIISIDYKMNRSHQDTIWLDADIKVYRGEKVKIEAVNFWGNKHVSSEYLRRAIQVKTPFWYSPEIISRYRKTLSRIDYIEVSPETYINKQDSTYEVIFKVKEGKLINFDFLVGYQPQTNKTGTSRESNWSGHVLFNFKNLFGGGRRLFIEWDKPSTISEELNLNFREPYIFNLPFHLEFGYRRLIEDSLFNSTDKRIRGIFPWNDFHLNFEYLIRTATNDSLLVSDEQPIRIKTQLTGIELDYDSRHEKVNPVGGITANVRLFTGDYDDEGSDSSFTKTRLARLEASSSWVIPVNNPFYIYLRGMGKYVSSSREKIPISEQFFIGGSTTVRGYRERQFLTEMFYGARIESRIHLSKTSRFHFFVDSGIFKGTENGNEWLTSYGAGFLIPVRLGLMEFDYGIPEGTNFNQGILHFRLINEF